MSIQQRFARLELLSRTCIETHDKPLAIELKIKLIQIAQAAGEGALSPEVIDIYNRALNLDSKISQVIVTLLEEETSLLLDI